MHAESGYWRPKPDGTIEVVIAQSNGLVEVQVLVFNFDLVFVSRIGCMLELVDLKALWAFSWQANPFSFHLETAQVEY